MKRLLSSLLIFIALLVMSNSKVMAVDVPSFPNCPFPGGELIASYDSGTHGVPGDVANYTGEDHVYKINENQVVQCLCADDGQGVQTWWWKQPSLTATQEAILNKDGWVRVPNGANWGLDATVYFAKNTYHDCNGRGGGELLGASTSVGSVLGADTMAGTGNLSAIVSLGVVSVLGFITARRLYKIA